MRTRVSERPHELPGADVFQVQKTRSKEQTMMTDACTLTAQHTVLATPIGDLTVVREGNLLTGLYFPHHWYKPDPVTFGPRNDRGFEGVAGQRPAGSPAGLAGETAGDLCASGRGISQDPCVGLAVPVMP
jgi:hypothetical protein